MVVNQDCSDQLNGASTAPPGFRVITGQLHRVRRGHGKTFVEKPPPPQPGPVRRPARVAVMLALAHNIQEAIDKGIVRDRAEVARRLELTPARVTQLLDLTLLAPDIQERILDIEVIDGFEPLTERTLRRIVRNERWEDQRRVWAANKFKGAYLENYENNP